VDSHFSHLRWKEMAVNQGGIGKIGYPLISDLDKSIARNYDVLLGTTSATVYTEDDELVTSVGGGVTVRGSFLIDEEGNVRHEIKNDLPLGRNIDEMLRLIDALDHHNKHGEVCPAGWTEGKSGMKPSDAGMKDFLSNNTEEL
jgi:peroxiredoxin (alkyl hydroperoxide reductase subunit C)